MNPVNNPVLKHIASRVRAEMEARDATLENPTKDLCGFCAIASARLHTLLKAAGIASELHVHAGFGSHVYLIVDDHVVDVTATQFSMLEKEKVVIMHAKEAECYSHWNSSYVFDNPAKLKDFQKKNNWPEWQTVSTV